RSEENDIPYDIQANDSIQSISDNYHIAPSELALINAAVLLSNNITIDIKNIHYEVRPEQRKPGKTLAGIANYFGVSSDAIKKINPGIPDFDNLAIWTLL